MTKETTENQDLRNKLKTIITNEKVKGAIAITAAAIMFFTPDHIDKVIESFLAAFGVSQFVISRKEK